MKTVSVVVSTFQRASELPKLIAALEQQTRTPDEVVIVDNGSTDDTSDVLSRLAASTTLRLRPIRLEANQGSSGGRNAGWRATTGDIIAFTDDDCLPDPDWLRAGIDAMGADGVALVQGRTLRQRKLRALERAGGSDRVDGLYPTCNVFYRRSALEATGGFDHRDATRLGLRPGSFGSGYGFGEDTLLAWRVSRTGAVAYAPDAVVRHAVTRPPVGEYITRSWIAGSFPALVREVPELRNTLLRSKVFLGYRRLPVYATAASAALGPGWLAAAGAVWWVAARAIDAQRRGGRWRRKLAALPIEMTVDVVSTVALLAGSARARTLVL